ncbi:hypothetical protein H7F28_01120 [Brevibacterium sp. PAMC23299]|nr:hypothetical protein H7F28_01120 [Brevibacterium sp. PAMC23299]
MINNEGNQPNTKQMAEMMKRIKKITYKAILLILDGTARTVKKRTHYSLYYLPELRDGFMLLPVLFGVYFFFQISY